MIPRVIARIDLSAIQHNLAAVRTRAPRCKVMAAVKANAYGHGAVPVARALQAVGVEALAVACLEEALALREAHIHTPIALLEGILSSEEAVQAVHQRLHVVVHDHWQLQLLEALPASAEVNLWFKLDSGMHRLGFPLDQISLLVEALARRPRWKFHGWFTHLACADDTANGFTLEQIARFNQALAAVSGARSIANSAGLLAWPQVRADWVRPGLMLYGASPFPDKSAVDLGLMPAMQLESRLIAIREYAAGEGIGYAQVYRCPERMKIGVVAAGYADGLPRSLTSGASFLIQGKHAPVAGRISMDMLSVDVRNVPQAQVGDRVLLWGEGLPVEQMAACAGTLAYELLCGLSQRVHLVHSDG